MPASRSSIRDADGFLGDHLVDGKMFSDVAQEIEEGNARRPRSVVHEPRGILFGFKIQQLRQLNFHAGDVALQNFLCEQLTFLGFPAWIANRAGRAAGHGNRMMAEQLKPPQREQRHEMADVQAVGGRVEAAVKRDGRGDFLFQFRRVGAIGDEAAPFQFFQNAHASRINCRRANANFQLKFDPPRSARPRPRFVRFEDENEDDDEED